MNIDYARHEHHDFLGASRQALADPPLAGGAGPPDQHADGRQPPRLRRPGRLRRPARPRQADQGTHPRPPRPLPRTARSVRPAAGRPRPLGGRPPRTPARSSSRSPKATDCKRIVKSKSMTSEEIHLNPALEAAGMEVTETDFGEFIIQLAGERPSHLVAPAVHHTRESIARMLSDHTGETAARRARARWRRPAGGCCARSSARPTWASPGRTSPSPRRARWCW